MFISLLRFELLLYAKKIGEIYNLLAIFMLIVTIFVMSQPHGSSLEDMAGGILWSITLISLSFTNYRIYLEDYENGFIEQYHYMLIATELIVLAKLLAHWTMTIVPIVIIIPLAYLFISGNAADEWQILMPSIMIGGFAFSSLGGMTAILSIKFERKDSLATIISLPLAIPLIIFGTSSLENTSIFDASGLIFISISAIISLLSIIMSAGILRGISN